MGNSFFDLEDQLEGDPQGSVISVILFAIATNNIGKFIPSAVSCGLYVAEHIILLWWKLTGCTRIHANCNKSRCEMGNIPWVQMLST